MRTTCKFRIGIFCALLFSIENQSSIAATINPVQPGATASYIPSSGAVACDGGHTCTTRLDPPGVINLGAANSTSGNGQTNITGLQSALSAEFPGFTYAYGGDLRNLVFNITTYAAFNTGVSGGASLDLKVTTTSGRLPGNLHWVQLLTDNWNITGYDPGPGATTGSGHLEQVIDGTYPTKASAGSPFYDFTGGSAFRPPLFQDGPLRGEPTPATPVIQWDAWLFLVSAPSEQGNTKAPVTITFYDGIEWGFQTALTPLPSTWTVMLGGLLGVGYLAFRRRGAVKSERVWPRTVRFFGV